MSPIKTPMKSALKGSVAPQSENETAAKADVSFLSPPKSVLKTTNARRLRNLMSVIDGHDDDSFSLDDSTRLNIAAKNDHVTDTSRQGKEGNDLYGFSKRGSQAASCSRWLFLITMLLAAAGLATTAYLTLEKDQDESFDREFESIAQDLITSSKLKIQKVFELMEGLTNTVTSSILTVNTESSNPGFITLPFVEEHFGTIRNASGSIAIAYLPLVSKADSAEWDAYTATNQGWIDESIAADARIFSTIWDFDSPEECGSALSDVSTRIPVTYDTDGPFAPVWTVSPAISGLVNKDMFGRANLEQGLQKMGAIGRTLFLESCTLGKWFASSSEVDYSEAVIASPVYDSFSSSAAVVGYLIEVFSWKTFWQDVMPNGTRPLVLQLESSCGHQSIYQVSGSKVELLSQEQDYAGDYPDKKTSSSIAEFANSQELVDEADLSSICSYSINIYPTADLVQEFDSQRPLGLAMAVVAVFLVTVVLFFLFDIIMTRQRNAVMENAKKQNALVSSLFPKSIQDKMLQEAEESKLNNLGKAGIKNYLNESTFESGAHDLDPTTGALHKSKPIADLFPDTTIMFGDISGFTAWSSTREPTQVFTLLETIYHAFDTLAKKHNVFKVEVVGDCYVAVCGLPDPRENHAIVMVMFAMECVREMGRMTHRLELKLGPDTADLQLRVGLHSGPVVAGVLRGEKSRFQLFGDTMNTASRMESTGKPNMVQISQETADLLEAAGKKHWFEPRGEKVEVKGKGLLTTYFLVASKRGKFGKRGLLSDTSSSSSRSGDSDHSVSSSSLGTFLDDHDMTEKKTDCVANWTVITLLGLLREIEARRMAAPAKRGTEDELCKLESGSSFHENGDTVISEVAEIIELPKFDAVAAEREALTNPDEIVLSDPVFQELKDYVRTISTMYRQNPFHNFPHANHVSMSVVKLLSRIKAPDIADIGGTKLHDHTYGITSDPLTRFAVVFSALIHDVDHMGVPNAVLVKEGDPVADLYNGTSVAEQNSIDVAWDLLMEPRFHNLRRQIYTTESEFIRFRQLVVNTVMATDIMDKNLKELRNKRWATAFAEDAEQQSREAINRKATIVIEHLIQASDVSHTMQHWHIYRKWNERFFEEMYMAYENGRLDSDPSENWYQGELGFFDFYIIPLAKKLKDCGVFGVSSDEYLNYAQQNRKEWEARGQQICAEMLSTVKDKVSALQVYKEALV